ncbi:citrate synthase [Scopulibacillus darangshiensis]|uniref:Citrate synthase n=1 Tax=Scopulibacillus darangshiensis TaxID=442528 RepID=A0A4R2P4D5_9BACL|nr:citrate synthase [Scopulibacillus darangshiensis]TCP29008.1 citrate synthase [Scopulibacillus darangshiensis]
MTIQNKYKPGLEGVIAAETAISYLDTEAEEIVIRGYDLIELADKKIYLDLIGVLLDGKLPSEEERMAIAAELKQHNELPPGFLDVYKIMPSKTNLMDALRSGISVLAGYDPDIEDRSITANRNKAMRLLAKIPNIVAGSYRIMNGKEPINPDKELSYSANFLYLITGRKPGYLEEDIFDQLLTVYSEHEMPNSTFTARVIASTHSDIYGALTGAVASLKGHLHGGANEAVMRMLLDAESPEGFRKMLYDKLAGKERVMGFGHRVYMDKMDPRASLMKTALKKLSTEKGDHSLLEMCEIGEEIMKEEKGLYPNLDYYAAPVYYLLGIPIDLYTPIFFAARTAGLCAHVIEQHANNRLFRPRVNYTGPRHLHP